MTFEEYAARQLPVLLRTAQAICADPQLAEDLVQDVLIKVHARWSLLETMSMLDAYVRRMLVNEFFSWRRKWARLVPQADPRSTRRDAIPVRDQASDYLERDQLVREIGRLPARQRVVISMRYLADLSDAQIAETLGCQESTVRVHAARGLATLRISYARAEQNQGD